jgi:hypothetical protein
MLFTRVECLPARAIACGAHHSAALVIAAWSDDKLEEDEAEASLPPATDADADAGASREDEEVVARRAKLLAMPELRVPPADEERQLLMWGRADQGTGARVSFPFSLLMCPH